MIELIIKNYLSECLTVPCYMEGPEQRPDRYLVIIKTGSSESNLIKRATIAIQSYAPSLYEAALLNETVKTAMADIPRLAEVSRCSLNSDYNFADTRAKEYRYQAVFDLTHY